MSRFVGENVNHRSVTLQSKELNSSGRSNIRKALENKQQVQKTIELCATVMTHLLRRICINNLNNTRQGVFFLQRKF